MKIPLTNSLLIVALLAGALSGLNSAAQPTTPAEVSIDFGEDERFLDIFQPPQSTHASLSPDGAHLAYSLRKDGRLKLVIVSVDNPGVIKHCYDLGSDKGATPMLTDNEEETPLAITWMRWTTPTRLVVMTNHVGATYRPFRPVSPRNTDPHFDTPDFEGETFRGFHLHDTMVTGSGAWISTRGAIFGIDLLDTSKSRVILRPGELRRLEEPPPERRMGTGYNNPDWVALQPSVFDFDKDDPASIILKCSVPSSSPPQYVFYRLNTITGKQKLLDVERGELGLLPLFDRQGRLRGGMESTLHQKPPFHYVLAKDKAVSLGRWNKLDEIAATDAASGFSVSPANQFGRRSIPIGFDEDPDILYFASNAGRETFGIYALNVKTGKRTDFSLEDPAFDLVDPSVGAFAGQNAMVFDRYDRSLVGLRITQNQRTTRWLRADLAKLQQDLEQTLPGRSVEIIEWDRNARRFLVHVDSPSSPGSFYVVEPALNKAFDIVRRAAWDESRHDHHLIRFDFNADNGHRISGLLTFPRNARYPTVPVVVRCAREPWLRSSLDFQPETIALADMGFAVLQVDSCGTWGYGLKHREAIKQGYEQAQIDDIVKAIDHLATSYRINPQRVALLGENHGGYVALRGLQLQPQRFRCAVSIDAPVDLGSWLDNNRWTRRSTQLELGESFYGDRVRLSTAPLLRNPELITKPVCLLSFPGLPGAPRTQAYLETRRLASALLAQGTPVEINELDKEFTGQIGAELPTATTDKSQLVQLDQEFAQRLPRAEAAVYRTIESFLNAYIYDYAVRLGPLKQIPDPVLRGEAGETRPNPPASTR